ncbi:hypothetical protein ACWELJ_04950 [Nocardia sp. NPDC004582]
MSTAVGIAVGVVIVAALGFTVFRLTTRPRFTMSDVVELRFGGLGLMPHRSSRREWFDRGERVWVRPRYVMVHGCTQSVGIGRRNGVGPWHHFSGEVVQPVQGGIGFARTGSTAWIHSHGWRVRRVARRGPGWR